MRVLGAIELVGATAPLPARLRRLLAVLLVRSRTVVPADTLTDVLWPERLPVDPEGALHNLVSRLRAALRAAPVAGPDRGAELLTRAPGYLLQVGPAAVDAALFEQLVREADRTEQTARRAALLDEALALWRGAAFAEHADEEFARAEAAHLEEVRAAALEARVDAALSLGNVEDAICLLEPHVAAHALRERPQSQLAQALSRAGRQTEALAALHRHRTHLAEELGLDPSPELLAVEEQVLRQDPGLGWVMALPRPRADRDSRPSSETGRTTACRTLPARALPAPAPLVGREEALTSLVAALDQARLVTLTGPGGVGKTSLAMRAARELGHGRAPGQAVRLVELASVRDPEGVPAEIATALAIGRARPSVEVTERVVEHLGAGRWLLVLDSCEHVVDAVAAMLQRIMVSCPGVTVLATSREALRLPSERVHPVLPLPVPPLGASSVSAVGASPAVALLLDRAANLAPGFALDAGNAEAVAEVCRRLDGVPLALELAAARLRSMTPAEVAGHLGAPLDFLRSSWRVPDGRHRTLRTVMDWSYNLLGVRERRLFDELSVFAGAFPLAAAALVHGDRGEDVGDLLAGLVDRSMVTASSARDGTTRYVLHETMRAYGQERLERRGGADAIRRAHVLWCVDLAEGVSPALRGPRARDAGDLVDAAHDDLRLAQAWAMEHEPRLALRLVAALADYCQLRMPPEVGGWAERAASAVPGRSHEHVVAWTVAAGAARFDGDLASARRMAERAVAAADGPRDPDLRLPLCIAAEVALLEGNPAEALRAAGDAQLLAGLAGDRARTGLALAVSALAHAHSGRASRARAAAAELSDMAAGAGLDMAAWALYVGAEVEPPDAGRTVALLEESLRLAREVDDRYLTGVALTSLALLHGRDGDPLAAVSPFRDAVDHWRRVGAWTWQWTTLCGVAELLAHVGDPRAAARLLGALSTRSSAWQAPGAASRLRALTERLDDELGPGVLAALRTEGAARTDDDAVDGALAALGRAGSCREIGGCRRRPGTG